LRPEAIVFLPPALHKDLCLRQGIEHFSIEELIPQLPDKGLDITVLPRTPGLDVECGHAELFKPVANGVRGKFGAVI
jgi:hypothetical protein